MGARGRVLCAGVWSLETLVLVHGTRKKRISKTHIIYPIPALLIIEVYNFGAWCTCIAGSGIYSRNFLLAPHALSRAPIIVCAAYVVDVHLHGNGGSDTSDVLSRASLMPDLRICLPRLNLLWCSPPAGHS